MVTFLKVLLAFFLIHKTSSLQRYSLCDLGTALKPDGSTWTSGQKYYSGEHTISANCSIMSTIYIRGTLKITGIADSNGAKPAIDGGWDGNGWSNTGVRLFYVENGNGLTIENIILTNGEVGASNHGGGFYINGGSISLSNSVVSGNTAHYGGGFYIKGGSISLSNCVVSDNRSNFGGGFNIPGGSIRIKDKGV